MVAGNVVSLGRDSVPFAFINKESGNIIPLAS